MIRPLPQPEPDENDPTEADLRVPVLTEEVDSIQVFEDVDTIGDKRYPPIQRPPVFPRVFAPPARSHESQ